MSGIVLVTGGSRGIGAATVRLAAAKGYDVAINYHSARAEADALAAEVAKHGVRTAVIQADVANEGDVLRLFDTVDRDLGPLTALVNNAGTLGGVGRLDEIETSMLRRTLDLNVLGSFLCAREAIRRMSTRHGGQGGTIVNLSSISARLGNGGQWVHYAASKGAVHTMTKGLAQEVGGEGIRVNAVAPGLIDTEIHAPAGGKDRYPKVLPTIPLARVGTTEEVAEAILWLMSDASSYVHGAILEVAGGR